MGNGWNHSIEKQVMFKIALIKALSLVTDLIGKGDKSMKALLKAIFTKAELRDPYKGYKSTEQVIAAIQAKDSGK